jgi:hypothetical protein
MIFRTVCESASLESTAEVRSQGGAVTACVEIRGDGAGKEDGRTRERSRISRPCREGSWKIQSHGDWDGVVARDREPDSKDSRPSWAGGGRPLAEFEIVVAAVGRMSWASLRPVRVDAKTEVGAPDGL